MKLTQIGIVYNTKCADCDWGQSGTSTLTGDTCTTEYFNGIVFAHIEMTGHEAFITASIHKVAHPDDRKIDVSRMMHNLDASVRGDFLRRTP